MNIANYNEDGKYLFVRAKTHIPPGMTPPPEIKNTAVFGTYEGEVNMLTQYHDVEFGGPVNMSPKPSEHHVFDYTLKQWLDPRTLQDLRDAKWVDIKRGRDAAEFANFTYDGMEFNGDIDAWRRLGSYISVSKSALAASQPFSAQFTLANNAEVTMTALDFVNIEMAKVQAVAAAFTHGVTLRAAIETASAAELDAISW